MDKEFNIKQAHQTNPTPEEVTSKLREMLLSLGERAIPCLVCEDGTMNRALFIPKDAEEFGMLDGDYKIACFPLCKSCYEEEEMNKCRRVRELLKESLGGEEVVH